MSANREKSTRIMGFVVSILLHGIFFAGCIAIDYTNKTDVVADPQPSEINQAADISADHKS